MKNGLMILAAAVLAAAPAGAAGSDADFARAAGLAMAAAVKSAQTFEPTRAEALQAAPEPEGKVVSDKTTTVSVELNAKTVKCSRADYSSPMLKVLIPALADLTVLNHRNTREGAPCVAAGQCGAIGPKDILGAGEGSEQVPVRVVLRKLASADADGCHVTLVETVATTIRGVAFFHERSFPVADRDPGDCR